MEQTFSSITELVRTFSECLRALTPYVSRVGITWQDGQNYDDWDAIAQTLYATVIDNSIAYTVLGKDFVKLTPYGRTMPDYAECSFLYCTEAGESAPFLILVQSEAPFDTAVFIELDRNGKPTGQEIRKPLLDIQFRASLKSSSD